MKCPKCDGTGKAEIGVGAFTIHGADCDQCNGKGIIEPLTNEEYLKSCDTEQLAEFLIASIKKCKSCASGIGADEVADCPFGECGCHFKDEVVEWLKQPHTKE